MEKKTIEQIRDAVMAYCLDSCKNGAQPKFDWGSVWLRDGMPMYSLSIRSTVSMSDYVQRAPDTMIRILYALLELQGNNKNALLPKLKWEQTFKANPWDGVSVCATYMGLDFHVELQDDGRFEMSAMLHGALYSFGKVAIRQRAINQMDKIFNEMLQSPIDVMRIAERYAKD